MPRITSMKACGFISQKHWVGEREQLKYRVSAQEGKDSSVCCGFLIHRAIPAIELTCGFFCFDRWIAFASHRRRSSNAKLLNDNS